MRWGVCLYNMFYTCPQPLANVGCWVMCPRLFSSVHFSHDRLTFPIAVGSDLLKKVCLHLTPLSGPLTVHISIDFTCKMALMAPDTPLNWGARSRFSYLTTNQWWDSLSSMQLMIGPTRFEKNNIVLAITQLLPFDCCPLLILLETGSKLVPSASNTRWGWCSLRSDNAMEVGISVLSCSWPPKIPHPQWYKDCLLTCIILANVWSVSIDFS